MRYRNIPPLEFTEKEDFRIEEYMERIEANIEREEMTPLERWKLALQLAEPDRVPVAMSSLEYNARIGGYKISEVLTDPKKAVIADLATVAADFSDTVMAWADPHVVGVELLGTKIEYPEDATAILREFPVKSREDLDKIKIPNPYRDGHLPMILQILEFVSDKVGDKVPILQCTNGPWGYAGDIRGYDKLMKDTRKDTDFVHALMEISTKMAITINKAFQEAGRNIITWPWDAMAEPECIGIKAYEELVWPYEKKVFERLTPPGAFLGLTTTEASPLDKLAETGAIALFTSMGGVEPAGSEREMRILEKAKRLVSKKVSLFTCCAYDAELLSGTPDEIKSIAKKKIEIGAPGGGFIIGGGVVPVNAPLHNCKAIMEAARKYGKY